MKSKIEIRRSKRLRETIIKLVLHKLDSWKNWMVDKFSIFVIFIPQSTCPKNRRKSEQNNRQTDKMIKWW